LYIGDEEEMHKDLLPSIDVHRVHMTKEIQIAIYRFTHIPETFAMSLSLLQQL